ncbi:hypothetical protein HNY73_017616 [Argiope bruennichi]|uniref:Uncharacterized protein n=1 Tax=Argiope bruennichi TaxID=94029 RepID=A0A8T0EAA2_ARGBR|nr:hypothetical protein HNY73_017616 [Argiope bruennichi]
MRQRVEESSSVRHESRSSQCAKSREIPVFFSAPKSRESIHCAKSRESKFPAPAKGRDPVSVRQESENPVHAQRQRRSQCQCAQSRIQFSAPRSRIQFSAPIGRESSSTVRQSREASSVRQEASPVPCAKVENPVQWRKSRESSFMRQSRESISAPRVISQFQVRPTPKKSRIPFIVAQSRESSFLRQSPE